MTDFKCNFMQHDWKTVSSASGSSFFLKGQAYIDQVPIKTRELAAALEGCKNISQLNSLLLRVNGFYAWVEQSPGQLCAGVDHIRSRPLFYGLHGRLFYISDDAEWVRCQVGDREMDPVAREEFQLAGYVTGADTLFANVKQLQAGECLIVQQTKSGLSVKTHRYYRFLHQESRETREAELNLEIDLLTTRVMQRLIDYADGRQIVVPLSGGHDSRLIATMLKRLKYDNVFTFTYGVLGNKESEYSKRVANSLGLPWHFVEYSEALWREAWQTTERWEYQRWSSGWSGIAHLQDWLAVLKLKQHSLVKADAIFVPGHTGDFISGGHIPKEAFKDKVFEAKKISQAILQKHYNLSPLRLFSTALPHWHARINDRTECTHCSEAWEYADAFEKWEWQERQAKFICNSVRVYEFFGYDWWMPLWDLEFIRYWERIPLLLRKNQIFYTSYVKEQYYEYASNASALGFVSGNNSRILSLVKQTIPRQDLLLNLIKKFLLLLHFHPNSTLAYEGWFPSDKYHQWSLQGVNINGKDALQFLSYVDDYLRNEID